MHSHLQKRLEKVPNLAKMLKDRVSNRVSLEGIILPHADLQSITLAGAQLQEANLRHVNLQQARLTGADLTGADLTSADLSGTNLRQAVLNNCILEAANLNEASLVGAELVGVNLAEAKLEAANISEANLERANLREANMFACIANKTNFRMADLRESSLESANLADANMRNAKLVGIDFDALTIVSRMKHLDKAVGAPDEWLTKIAMEHRGPQRKQRPGSGPTGRPVSNLLPDDYFGDNREYKVIQKLGKGGTAIVYLIEDLTDPKERVKALKILDPRLGAEEINVKRFKREGLIGKNIRHSKIIRIFDIKYSKAYDTYYLVMEYIDGIDLKDLLNRYWNKNKPFPAKMGIDIVFQICQGLAVAHKSEIVHRDLKPANVLIRKSGKIVLTDFGLSKINSSVETTLHLTTMPGTLLGTPGYMSPEQVVGGELTILSDIYSLGVIMYEMFVGQQPYTAHNILAWVNVIRSKYPTLPSKINSKFPLWLEEIIMKCLAKRPDDRFQSTEDIIKSIQSKRVLV